jgi:membrane protein
MSKPQRHRAASFARFTARRFLDENCLQSAAALAFTSLFALVPLITVVLGILSAFPVYSQWRESITRFVFDNFLPATGEAVQGYFTQFADNASKATAVGILVLVFSAVSLMLSIEGAFNRIWRVRQTRRAATRFAIYWTTLTLGPFLLVTMLALMSWVFASPVAESAAANSWMRSHLLGVAPFLLQWLVLAMAYALIPSCAVRPRHALVAALLIALAFEAAKRGFVLYAGHGYAEIYGVVAVVPLFIFWIYLAWILVLLGASLTASLTAFAGHVRETIVPSPVSESALEDSELEKTS